MTATNAIIIAAGQAACEAALKNLGRPAQMIEFFEWCKPIRGEVMRVLNTLSASMAVIVLSGAALADDHVGALSAEELLPLAQEEGTVAVHSFTSRSGGVNTTCERENPDMNLLSFDISSTRWIARLRVEAQAGVTNANVVCISDTPAVLTETLEAGIIPPPDHGAG